jgi:hypothetical protein
VTRKKSRRSRGRGRPKWRPTEKEREQVRLLVAVGTRLADVAAVLGVSVPTLRKNCRDEIKTAATKANGNVAAALYKAATGERPNVLAQMFWLKTRAQWVEFEKLLRGGDAEGKKEQRKAAAAKVASSGRFKPAAPPRLATVNGEPVKPATEAPKP